MSTVTTRAAARAAVRMLGGGFTGASLTRRALQEWDLATGSADAVTLPDLSTLRDRSRDLVRNHPLAGGAIQTNVTSVVGRGLRVQPRINRELLGLSREEADRWERRAKQLFNAVQDQLDITRRQPFWVLQDLALRSPLEAGDAFAIRRFKQRHGDVLGLKIQLVEADRVCNPDHRWDTERLRAGIELDEDGAEVACHVADRYPGDLFHLGLAKWKRVPFFAPSGERQVLHLFKQRRIGQTRGVPYLAPVIETFKQLGRYTDAEIMAAVVNAMLTVLIKSEPEEDAGEAEEAARPVLAPSPEDAVDGDIEQAEEDVIDTGHYKLGSGTMLALAPGEDATVVATNRPSANYDPFMMAILRQIGVGLELPFEVFVKHFTASYSAARAALLEAWRYFLVSRHWVATGFCQPAYEWAITEAIARDLLEAPGFFDDPLVRRAWLGAAWLGDAMGQIDPKKEADAAVVRLEAHLSTHEIEIAQITGQDWEDVFEQRGHELAHARAEGLDLQPQPAGAAVATEPEPDPDQPDLEEE